MSTKLPEHKIAVIVKYHGPTNTRGSRVSLNLTRWNKRVSFSYTHEGQTLEQACSWFEAKGIPVDSFVELKNEYVLSITWTNRPAVFAAFGLPEN